MFKRNSNYLFLTFLLFIFTPDSFSQSENGYTARKQKTEISPKVLMNLNDNFQNIYSLGIVADHYLSDIIALEVEGSYFRSKDNDFINDLINDFGITLNNINKEKYLLPGGVLYNPLNGRLRFHAGGGINYDFYLLCKSGIIGTDAGIRFVLTPGFGQRFFLTRSLAIRYEMSSNMFSDDSKYKKDLNISLGLSYFIPSL